ncbi:CRE-BATH-38 protein [Aphelenchoides avenae]|nr:CRE-BATH-38 protein [Aphelenchus avenae]
MSEKSGPTEKGTITPELANVCGTSLDVFETDGAFPSDIKLKVGDNVFYVNKGYLSVVSSVFRDMFAFTEAAENKIEMEPIELKDLDAREFQEFLGVIYPTRRAITDANVIRIADRFGVKGVMADCESHLYSASSVPVFDKLKLTVDFGLNDLRDYLVSAMPPDDIRAINENENKGQLGADVLGGLLDRLIRALDQISDALNSLNNSLNNYVNS